MYCKDILHDLLTGLYVCVLPLAGDIRELGYQRLWDKVWYLDVNDIEEMLTALEKKCCLSLFFLFYCPLHV